MDGRLSITPIGTEAREPSTAQLARTTLTQASLLPSPESILNQQKQSGSRAYVTFLYKRREPSGRASSSPSANSLPFESLPSLCSSVLAVLGSLVSPQLPGGFMLPGLSWVSQNCSATTRPLAWQGTDFLCSRQSHEVWQDCLQPRSAVSLL